MLNVWISDRIKIYIYIWSGGGGEKSFIYRKITYQEFLIISVQFDNNTHTNARRRGPDHKSTVLAALLVWKKCMWFYYWYYITENSIYCADCRLTFHFRAYSWVRLYIIIYSIIRFKYLIIYYIIGPNKTIIQHYYNTDSRITSKCSATIGENIC